MLPRLSVISCIVCKYLSGGCSTLQPDLQMTREIPKQPAMGTTQVYVLVVPILPVGSSQHESSLGQSYDWTRNPRWVCKVQGSELHVGLPTR